MNYKSRIGQAALLLVMSVSLAACGSTAPSATPEPTVDLAVVKTDAVGTAVAQLTADAPKATATSAPTATTAFTSTLPVLATSAPVTLATATKTKIVYSGGGGAVAPTVNTYVDQAKLVSQTPADSTVFEPGAGFDAKWTVQNSGKRDWTNDFYFKYLDGDIEGRAADIVMIDGLDKGDNVTLTVDMVAPQEPGIYRSEWGIVNDDAVTFFHFYVVIVVR